MLTAGCNGCHLPSALPTAVPMPNGTTAADDDGTIVCASIDLPVRPSPPPAFASRITGLRPR